MTASQTQRSASRDGVVLSSEYGQLCWPFPASRFSWGALRNASPAVKILFHCSGNCHLGKQGVRLIIKPDLPRELVGCLSTEAGRQF